MPFGASSSMPTLATKDHSSVPTAFKGRPSMNSAGQVVCKMLGAEESEKSCSNTLKEGLQFWGCCTLPRFDPTRRTHSPDAKST
eukprot:1021854-Amphidinium_carterae.1